MSDVVIMDSPPVIAFGSVHRERLRPTWWDALPILVVFVLIVPIDLGKDLVSFVARGQDLQLSMFHGALLWWGTWIAFIPLLLALARWARPSRGGWRRTISLHLPFGLVVVLLHEGITAWLFLLAGLIAPSFWMSTAFEQLNIFFIAAYAVYVSTVGSHAAFDDYRRFQEARLDVLAAERRAADMETALSTEEIRNLSVDLRSGFLHDALASLRHLIQNDRPDEAVHAIARLGDLLRMARQSRPKAIPLRDELDLMSTFIDIELIRHPSRECVQISLEEGLTASVSPLSLRPLAEQVVRSMGQSLDCAPGSIVAIHAERCGEEIHVSVSKPDQKTGLGSAVVPMMPGTGAG